MVIVYINEPQAYTHEILHDYQKLSFEEPQGAMKSAHQIAICDSCDANNMQDTIQEIYYTKPMVAASHRWHGAWTNSSRLINDTHMTGVTRSIFWMTRGDSTNFLAICL